MPGLMTIRELSYACYWMLSDRRMRSGTALQYAVRNQQTYHLSQSGFLAKHLFPEVVDLDVTTTLILDPQASHCQACYCWQV